MAVTKIWDVKGNINKPIEYVKNPEKTENPLMKKDKDETLDNVIAYAANEDKTEMRLFVSAINCNTTYAARQFDSVKKQFGKEGGIIAFHGYQSFAPGETTPEQAHEIGVKLAEELWGDRFQVVVATHLNTNCIHNHFLLNSVSFMDGKRYHDCKDTYRKMQEVSDRLCREYSLSVVEKNDIGNREPIYIAHKSAEGEMTRYNMTRDAVDEAIRSSRSMYEFEKRLKSLGYITQFDANRKYWTVTPKGWRKPIRLARLGEEYTNDRIYERIHDNNYVPFETIQKRKYKQYNLPTRWDRIKHVKGVKGIYLKYCYLLGYLPKYKQSQKRVHYLLRDEIIMCEKYSEQIRLMSMNDLITKDDVAEFVGKTEKKMQTLESERAELRKEVKRVIPEEDKVKKKSRITEITGELKKLRKERDLAKDIPERGEKMEEKMKAIEMEEKQKEKQRRR